MEEIQETRHLSSSVQTATLTAVAVSAESPRRARDSSFRRAFWSRTLSARRYRDEISPWQLWVTPRHPVTALCRDGRPRWSGLPHPHPTAGASLPRVLPERAREDGKRRERRGGRWTEAPTPRRS
ncbi:hypothetical protein SRHO_G00015330 [Serrasalmus rhombeus]